MIDNEALAEELVSELQEAGLTATRRTESNLNGFGDRVVHVHVDVLLRSGERVSLYVKHDLRPQ